jgi:hypothetical protein
VPPPASPGRSYPARYDPDALAEDLEHTTSAAASIAVQLQRELDTGRFTGQLRPCDTSARDQTSLPNCLKTYLPAPDGAWGAVFELRRDPAAQLYLALLAFGRRHPDQPWQPSVYQIADRRLHHA